MLENLGLVLYPLIGPGQPPLVHLPLPSCPIFHNLGPSVDDQAVSLSDDGTTIIIDFFSLFFLSSFFLPPFNSSHSPLAF
jgi:hypothetical protein